MLMNKFQRKRKQGGRVGFARAILAARAVPYLFCLSHPPCPCTALSSVRLENGRISYSFDATHQSL